MNRKLIAAMWIGSAVVFTALMASMLMAQLRKPVSSEQSKRSVSNELSQHIPNDRPLEPVSNDLHIVIKKSARTLELFDGATLIKSYKTALGLAPSGDKEIAGDGKTPEGDFYVFVKNAQSKFYLSLGLSYPNAEDAERGLADKLITRRQYDQILKAIANKKAPPQNTKLGGEIYIHGGGTGDDWTWGCIALENADIKALFDTAFVGMRVKILP
jgi:murein L,D-transpeptidase YafK